METDLRMFRRDVGVIACFASFCSSLMRVGLFLRTDEDFDLWDASKESIYLKFLGFDEVRVWASFGFLVVLGVSGYREGFLGWI